MRLPMIRLSTIDRLINSVLVFSTLVQNAVVAIPHVVYTRQTSILSVLQLPTCAFMCFLTHLLDDGCANEADFPCHCMDGKLIQASMACIMQGCGSVQGDEAVAKLKEGCRLGLDGGLSQTADTSMSSTTAASMTSSSEEATVTTPLAIESSTNSATTYQATIRIPATTIASTSTTGSASSTLLSTFQTATLAPTSTETAIPSSAESDQLSPGAKAGIGVSVAALPLVAAVILAWYIRRLKSRAHAAKLSDSTPATPDPAPAVRGRQITQNAYPISPLSPSYPGGMQDDTTISNIGYGMVMKKRGHVLSILLEREDEDKNSVREPIPGQREGLAPPLELDGEGTAVWELPTTITPRNRSVER